MTKVVEVDEHKGFSEETCVRCGWRMGSPALSCQNDGTPHVFGSEMAVRLALQEAIRDTGEIAGELLAALQPWQQHTQEIRSGAVRLTVSLASLALRADEAHVEMMKVPAGIEFSVTVTDAG